MGVAEAIRVLCVELRDTVDGSHLAVPALGSNVGWACSSVCIVSACAVDVVRGVGQAANQRELHKLALPMHWIIYHPRHDSGAVMAHPGAVARWWRNAATDRPHNPLNRAESESLVDEVGA